MAVRPIDIQPIIEEIQSSLEIPSYSEHDKGFDDGLKYVLDLIEKPPTLTPQNEPLTLISMSDEIPPDNERVLVYRPCMVDSDTGPYSVQWGWAAKRDGSHWARLPDRRPPEGEV